MIQMQGEKFLKKILNKEVVAVMATAAMLGTVGMSQVVYAETEELSGMAHRIEFKENGMVPMSEAMWVDEAPILVPSNLLPLYHELRSDLESRIKDIEKRAAGTTLVEEKATGLRQQAALWLKGHTTEQSLGDAYERVLKNIALWRDDVEDERLHPKEEPLASIPLGQLYQELRLSVESRIKDLEKLALGTNIEERLSVDLQKQLVLLEGHADEDSLGEAYERILRNLVFFRDEIERERLFPGRANRAEIPLPQLYEELRGDLVSRIAEVEGRAPKTNETARKANQLRNQLEKLKGYTSEDSLGRAYEKQLREITDWRNQVEDNLMS